MPTGCFPPTHRESRQVIRVEASAAAERLITRQNILILQQGELSGSQGFAQLQRLSVGAPLPVHHSVQQALGGDPPLRGGWRTEGAAVERHGVRPVLDGVGRQAKGRSRHQAVAAQQEVALGGGEVSTQADLPVGLVAVGAEQQDPDALKGDTAPRRVPELDVLAVLRHAGRVSVQLIDQEIAVAPRREVRR